MLAVELLSRIQFAFTISFHILFPSFSIGLATFLAIMEGLWLKTKNPEYLKICKFWMKVFALTFGMGVVSGIVMEFQLGTNWAHMTKVVGPVLGALFTYEVLTAFFIEAGFLGVMIFGWNKVGPKLHYCATLLVFFGVTLSAFWILSANSWMQTPAGATLQNGHFVVTNWWHVIFNPSVIPRYFHMMLAAYITTLVVISSISAYYLLKKEHLMFAKKCFSFATMALLILICIQLFMGDAVGLEVHKNQPLKTAAMEGVWKTQTSVPFVLFAYPSNAKMRDEWPIKIPYLASLINTHSLTGKLIGLDSVPAKDRPFVPIVFYSFRIMVGMGLIMLALGIIALILRLKSKLYTSRWFHKLCILCAPVGFIAIITGWFTAEVGRQPWVVYNLLRTSNSFSDIQTKNVIISLILIVIIYGIIFGYFYFKYLGRIIKHGPDSSDSIKMPFAYLHTGGA